MGRTIYMECHSGISGDMTVAALLDLGADQEVLKKVLDSLPVRGFRTKISRVKKSGFSCMDFSVILEKEFENHDDDMGYLYGHEHGGTHEHGEPHEHGESHEHGEIHKHGKPHKHGEFHEHGELHTYRNLKDIMEILQETKMTERAKKIAGRIFRILAEAEAKAHGETVETVHFHEVGAVDSIVDIVSAAVCFDNLDITEVIVPEVCEGSGTIRCAHGILPVPVPAVVNILEAYRLPVRFTKVRGELVTPTGAAILAAMMTSEQAPEKLRIEKVGLGAGKRIYEMSGILRMMLVRPVQQTESESRKNGEGEAGEKCDFVYKLEANMDDCTGEALGYVMERLFEAGARDVHYIPVYMKKNRPGIQLNVICDEKDREELEKIIFLETTTIGIRRIPYERTILQRSFEDIDTKFGKIRVKVCELNGKKRYCPEYESVAEISREKGISFQEVYAEAVKNTVW